MQKDICLVVPCYQEAKRLGQSVWPRANRVSFIFVDDGSDDGTADVLETMLQPGDQLLRLKKNVGKAEAVRQGMLFAINNEAGRDAKWVGFWDADLATPLNETDEFLITATRYPNAKAIWGSRIYRCGSRIERNFTRHVLGRLFATVAKLYLGLETYDSQCGAKLFAQPLVPELFSRPFISRWLFDVEIYLRFSNPSEDLVEHPLRAWRDVPGGKLKIGRTAFRTLFDLARIKRSYRKS